MPRKDQDLSLYDIGEELIRLGNLLKTKAASSKGASTISRSASSQGELKSKTTSPLPLSEGYEAMAQQISMLDRTSAEERLMKLSVKVLLTLGREVGTKLDSKARKSDLVKRLICALFDSERGGELLRTLYQRVGQKDEKASFERDRQWFLQHKNELLANYREQFVAILDGKIVGNNADFETLAREVHDRYGYRDLFMPWVSGQNYTVRMPSPRFGKLPS